MRSWTAAGLKKEHEAISGGAEHRGINRIKKDPRRDENAARVSLQPAMSIMENHHLVTNQTVKPDLVSAVLQADRQFHPLRLQRNLPDRLRKLH